MSHTARINPSYETLRSLYLGAEAMRSEHLSSGRVTVLIQDDDEFTVEGSLNPQGQLSGMAKLYHRLGLTDGVEIEFDITPDGNVLITSYPEETPTEEGDVEPTVTTVFERQNLRRIHIEPFRPENLDNWDPETETDVYLAFGVLQDFTDYQYCCGASQSLLDKLGADYAGGSKPDAVLIDRSTDQYLMAEWKKNSSDFKTNHEPEDVDVLVCWNDNETDRTVLPRRVLALHAVAQTAVETRLGAT